MSEDRVWLKAPTARQYMLEGLDVFLIGCNNCDFRIIIGKQCPSSDKFFLYAAADLNEEGCPSCGYSVRVVDRERAFNQPKKG